MDNDHSNIEEAVDDVIEIDDDQFEDLLNDELNSVSEPTKQKQPPTSLNKQHPRTVFKTTNQKRARIQPTKTRQANASSDVLFVQSSVSKSSMPQNPSASCFTCAMCKSRFLTKVGLEQHMKKEHRAQEAPLICSICNKQFPGHSHFLGHLPTCRRPETTANLLLCAHCRKNFSSKSDFMRHLTTDHPEVAELQVQGTTRMPRSVTVEMVCGQCGQRFTARDQLTEHLAAQHSRPCAHCDTTFTDPSRYQEHLRSTHMCLTCGFYGAGEVLESHRREHVFPCIDCADTFDSPGSLEKHIEKHPAQCRDCQDEFRWAIVWYHLE